MWCHVARVAHSKNRCIISPTLHACVLCCTQGKKGRKRGRKKSDLERDLEEAEAGPDARELALLQSQMLEVGFCVGGFW
jgi:hypothetical protein